MRKILLFALLFAIASGCVKQGQSVLPASEEATQIFRYQPYNFEFKYPASRVFTQPLKFSAEEPVVAVRSPENLMPGTNFADAAFTVGVTLNSTEQKCYASPPGASNISSKEISAVKYYSYSLGDAGAGNFYQSQIYKIVKNSICFEIVQTIHSTNIGNYEPGTVKEFDKNIPQQILQQITESFLVTK